VSRPKEQATRPRVCCGSWLCKNPKTLNRDRRSYSSETALVVRLAMEFNFKNELKNIILVAFRYFEFLHSRGQNRKSWPCGGMSALPPINRHCQAVSAGPKSATSVLTHCSK
jgi:hypothetical protein